MLPCSAQTLFLDFNTPGQYTGNFNAWNDNGSGGNGGNYSFAESPIAGAGGSGGVSVFQSSDTTATFKNSSWDFSTNSATLILSVLLKANGQTSGNKVQFGIINSTTNGFNSNTGVAFETFRFIPSSATVWSLREQYRTGNTNTETTLGNVSVVAGRWYKFVIGLTNTSGATGDYNAGCALFDYGLDGLTPGTNATNFSTLEIHTTGQDIAKLAQVWPGLRAYQNAGIDAWDNFLVYTPASKPILTFPLTNSSPVIGSPATFKILADGPGTISYAWYTNGTLVVGATAYTYTTPPITADYTNLTVVATNPNGATTNSVTLTPIVPSLAVVTNAPATDLQTVASTLNGQVLSTGGEPPDVTLFYGATDGGTNQAAWAQNVDLGIQSGAFSQWINGLSPGTTYFYTARAINGVGTSWAAPSASFTTPLVPPPPTTLVNPFLGSAPGGGSFGFSGDSGDTFPGAAYPRGMVQFSPDTPSNLPGGYNYLDNNIKGFSVRHFSGRGCTVYQDFAFMPCLGPITVSPATNSAYNVGFSHMNETAAPGYYSVLLANGVRVELTVTKRTGLARFTFPSTNAATMFINAGSTVNGTTANTAVTITSGTQVQGYATAPIGCGSELYTIYFAAQFDRAWSSAGTWNGGAVSPGSLSSSGAQCGAFFTFDATTNPVVYARAGISFVSVNNALANLTAENTNFDFTAIQTAASSAWNVVLNKIVVSGGTIPELQTFYSALYHCFFHPNVFSDANGLYLGMDKVLHAVAAGHAQYENIPGWDTYRSETPLLAFLSPDETSDIMQSLVNYAQQGGGGLPRWEQANRNSAGMVGDGPVIMLATAFALGATNFNTAGALTAMNLDANNPSTTSDGNTVRSGLSDYINLGYVSGSASVTLEYASADFALSQFAAGLGDLADYYTYLRRSGAWRNLYNVTNGFMQPRFADGSWATNVTATTQTGYTEGSAAQYTWLVPFNLRGLFDAMGGNSNAVARLDTFFTQLNSGPGSQYAFMGNEPCEAVPWEYDYAGAPAKAQATIRRIQTTLFTNTPGGLPGNDDAGALSSWYVFSALGFYPLIPGVGGFVLGSPRFPNATINLENGRQINIQGLNASPSNCYVQGLTLNGASTTSLWLPFAALRDGADLVFTLGSTPSSWGTGPADAPPSFNQNPMVPLTAALLANSQQLSLSWPGWATNYRAYSATNLLPPTQWSAVTNSPQSSNGLLYLTLPATNAPQQFFRLGMP